jgi:hypothetical protein
VDCTDSTSFPSALVVTGTTNFASLSPRDSRLVSHHCRLTAQPGEEILVYTSSVDYETTLVADFIPPAEDPPVDYVIGTECIDVGSCVYATVGSDYRSVVIAEADHHVGVTPMHALTGSAAELKRDAENRMVMRWSGGQVVAWLNGMRLGQASLQRGRETGWPNFAVINVGKTTVEVDLDRFAVFASK